MGHTGTNMGTHQDPQRYQLYTYNLPSVSFICTGKTYGKGHSLRLAERERVLIYKLQTYKSYRPN